MALRAAADLLATWICDVHVASAASRVAEMLLENARRDQRLHSSSSNGSASMGRLALHEGAHSVVSTVFGMRPGRVVVRADGSGFSTYTSTEDHGIALAVTHLAGAAAELFAGVDEARQFALATSYDILATRLAIDQPAGVVPEGFSATVVARLAVCTVSEHWLSISRVAACLRALGELSGPEVEALSGRAQ